MYKNIIRQSFYCVVLVVSLAGVCYGGAPIPIISDDAGTPISTVYALVGETVHLYGDESYDTDEDYQYITGYAWAWGRSDEPDEFTIENDYQNQTSHLTLMWETPGTRGILLKVRDDEMVYSNYTVCKVVIGELITVDTDRDGQITWADEASEDTWSQGPSGKGAIVLPNCDDDNGDGVPDNWLGANDPYYAVSEGRVAGDWDFDDANAAEDANEAIDSGGDVNDIADLWFHQIPQSLISANYDVRVTIEVENTSTHSFLSGVADCNVVRIFLADAGDTELEAGDSAIIGPEDGDSVTYYKLPVNQLARFTGDGVLKMGVEGIEFGAEVSITVTLETKETQDDPFVEIETDTVEMKVAPFVLCDHTMDVKNSGTQKTVYILDVNDADPNGNNELKTALGSEFSLVDEVLLDSAYSENYEDRWHQDGYEVGYVKAPYGEMPVFLVLPRAFRDVQAEVDVLAKYVHRMRLEADVGVCWRLEGLGWLDGHNCGGNVESIPYASGPGDFFYGIGGSGTGYKREIDPNIIDFFVAQDVNPPCDVNTSWLKVGHVDEVVSFASDATHTFVADPIIGWGLLIWAAHLDDPYDPNYMHNSMTPDMYDLYDQNDPSSGRTVGAIRNSTNLNLGYYNLPINGILGDISATRSELGLDSGAPETITEGTCGEDPYERTLTDVSAFVGFFDQTRYYRIEFFDTEYGLHKYHMYWSTNPNETWDVNSPTRELDSKTGCVGDNLDYLFEEAMCLVLFDRWEGGAYIQDGDIFLFEADPDSTTIEVPVLFALNNLTWAPPGASAYTTDHVNCLVDGDTVFTGEPYGPHVWNGKDPNDPDDDIFRSYVVNLFERVYTDVNMPPSRYYHNGSGDIHCGTNVRREIPTSYDWWEYSN